MVKPQETLVELEDHVTLRPSALMKNMSPLPISTDQYFISAHTSKPLTGRVNNLGQELLYWPRLLALSLFLFLLVFGLSYYSSYKLLTLRPNGHQRPLEEHPAPLIL